MNIAHRLARRWIPRRARAELAWGRRAARDRSKQVRFASQRGSLALFPHAFERYRLPILIYPGQEHLALGKRRNQQLMAAALHGIRVDPGEVLSLWRVVGRPTAARGYLPGAAIVGGRLTAETGGATCLFSTVLYNAGLLAGLEIVERHAHSVDTYGESRYFELGHDATIEFGVLDLRFRNPYEFPVLLDTHTDAAGVATAFRAPVPDLPKIGITVSCSAPVGASLIARTYRTVTPGVGPQRHEDLGSSRYRLDAAAGSRLDAAGERTA